MAHMVVGVTLNVGTIGASTVIVVVLAAKRCSAVGVKVRVTVPLNPLGLKLLVLTPLPLQLPETVPTLLPKAMGLFN